jgi:hypothetical protein
MLAAVRIWILLSTLLVSAGWILSALHQLNRAGYATVFALAGIFGVVWWQRSKWPTAKKPAQVRRIFLRRFKRPAPLLFLILTSMSLVSGLIYAPHNSDTYAYRLPRILHWLDQGQWHWIHTADMRMNVAACGYEWLIAPIILFTRTDHFLFLINWLSYLMLPGLTFCVFRFWGLRPRVAWWWAWLLSSGWCYVMQSASVANDGLAVIYALAAVALAMKARETGKAADFWLSLLAAALLTGIKQTAIPLAGLWMLAAWPERRVIFANPKIFFVMAVAGLLVSGVPITIFNFLHTGTWSGLSAIQAEYPDWRIQLDSPLWGIVGNAFCIPAQNLLPPFFPWSGSWNHAMDVFLTTPFGARFKSFEHFGALSPGISESSAGIGLAIVLMTVVSIYAARKYQIGPQAKCPRFQLALRLCPWILLVVFMAKVGEAQNARHLAGYYVFIFPSLLASAGHEKLVRKAWWQGAALFCMSLSAVLLIANTTRPLFPALTITRQLAASHPHSKIITILQDAYLSPRSVENAGRQINESLPPDALVVGYAAAGNAQLEPALWWPFGARRVERVLKTDSPGQLIKQGIRYVVIENRPSVDFSGTAEWMTRYHASLISELTFQDKGHDSAQPHVYIMRLDDK